MNSWYVTKDKNFIFLVCKLLVIIFSAKFQFQLPIIQDIQKLDAKHPVVEMFMDEVFNTVENLELLCEV